MTDIKAPSLQWKPALTDRGETATFSPTKIIEEGDTLYHDPNFDDNRMTLRVPTGKATASGLRKISSKKMKVVI